MSAGHATLEVPPPVLEFLAKRRTLTLATSSPAAVPRATTVLYVNEGPTLYFWSRATTLTTRQIQQNPVVAFISGSRGNHRLGDVGNELGLLGDDYPRRTQGVVRHWRVVLLELGRERLQRFVGVNDRQPLDLPLVVADVDDTPCVELIHRQPGNARQRLQPIGCLNQRTRQLGQEQRAAFRPPAIGVASMSLARSHT